MFQSPASLEPNNPQEMLLTRAAVDGNMEDHLERM